MTALRRGTEPDSVTLPEKDDAWFQRRLESGANSFVAGQDLRDRTDDTDPTKLESPLKQFQSRLKSVLDKSVAGETIPPAELLLIEETARSVYGFPIDTTDGTVNEKDRVQLLELHALLESGAAPNDISVKGAFNTQAAEQAIEQARAAELAAKQEIYTIESGAAVLGFGSVNGELTTLPETVLGKPGHELDRVLVEYSDQLQRHFGKNIFQIRDGMLANDGKGGLILTNGANDVMEYLVQNTDITAKVTELATSTNPNDIRQLQGILRLSGVDDSEKVQTTGEIDIATLKATIEFLEQDRGMGDTTLAFTRAPDGSKLDYNISTSAILDKLEKGTLQDPTKLSDEEMAKLPEDFRARIVELRADAEGLDPLEQREIIADFLSEEDNYIAFDKYLKGRDHSPLVADLKEKLEPLEAEAREIRARGLGVASAGSVEAHKEFTGDSVVTGAAIKEAHERLLSEIEKSGTAWDAIYDRIPADFTPSSDTPPEVLKFIELRNEIDNAGSDLASYKLSPLALNTRDTETIKGQYSTEDPLAIPGAETPTDLRIVGFTGGIQESVKDRLEIREMAAQNAHMEYFASLTPERRQAVLSYLDKREAGLEASPEKVGSVPSGLENQCGWFKRTFGLCAADKTDTTVEVGRTPELGLR